MDDAAQNPTRAGPSRRRRFWIILGTAAGIAFWLWGFWVYANAHGNFDDSLHGVARIDGQLTLVSCHGGGIGQVTIIEGNGYEGPGYWAATLAPGAEALQNLPLATQVAGYEIAPSGQFKRGGTYTIVFLAAEDGRNLSATVETFVPDQIPEGEVLDGQGDRVHHDEWRTNQCSKST